MPVWFQKGVRYTRSIASYVRKRFIRLSTLTIASLAVACIVALPGFMGSRSNRPSSRMEQSDAPEGMWANASAFALQAEDVAANRSGKALRTEGSFSDEQIHNVLASLKAATRNEDMDSLVGLLDKRERTFVLRQKAKARMLFRQFDQIDGAYSNVKIEPIDSDSVAVNLHCMVKGSLAKNGREVVVFDGAQRVTMKRTEGMAWKVCAID